MSAAFILRPDRAPYVPLTVRHPVVTLGRHPVCNLVVDHTSVSREHAEIRICDGRLEVIDRGSRNGTFVAGRRIKRSAVAPGEIVQFGAVPFRIEICRDGQLDSDDETDHPPPQKFLNENATSVVTGPQLTRAQKQVLPLLLAGKSDKEMAVHLGLSPNTVHHHVEAIKSAFGVNSRPELLAKYYSGQGRG